LAQEAIAVMTRWHDGWGPGAWIAMFFVMLVFWTIVVGTIIAVMRSGHLRDHDHDHGPARLHDAERILAERFARGEIDADEYKQRSDLLRSS
jgi:putative membrane protein